MIAVMVFGFARVSAVAGLRVRDYYTQGKRSYLKLHEKGGRFNQVPAHHLVQEYMDAYLAAAGIDAALDSPLFRASAQGKRNELTERGMRRESVWGMVKRRAEGCPPLRDQSAFVQGDWHHRVHEAWRRRGDRGADRRSRVDADDSALQPCSGGRVARRDRADPDMSGKEPDEVVEDALRPAIWAAMINREGTAMHVPRWARDGVGRYFADGGQLDPPLTRALVDSDPRLRSSRDSATFPIAIADLRSSVVQSAPRIRPPRCRSTSTHRSPPTSQ